MIKFAHLHLHTEFSLLDGLGKIDEYIKLAKKFEMPGFAITDHGNMFGAIKFYHSAKSAGIKPLIGCEVYVAPRSRFLKEGSEDKEYNHLLLIAINNEGYRNLSKIVSKSWIEGFYYKPRVDHDLLAEFSKGIIATSGCLGSEVADAFRSGSEEKMKKIITDYVGIFGKENYYIELQDHPEIKDQINFNESLIKISKEMNLPLILTKDTHYAEKSDNVSQDALVCIQTGKLISDSDRMTMMNADFSFSSPDEMEKNFSQLPESLKNTFEIVERSEIDLDFKQWVFPTPQVDKNFKIQNFKDENFEFQKSKEVNPNDISVEKDEKFEVLEEKNSFFNEQKDISENLNKKSFVKILNDDEYRKILLDIVFERGEKRLGRKFNKEELERLDYELDVIHEKGYDKYTLVVMDFVDFMKREKIPTTTRGSAAGSLVSYFLGITTVNPLEFKLPFERYLNRERPSAPDIDLDIADSGREKVIQYAIEKYGKENVAQIITFGRMHAKAAIRDVGRVLGLSYGFVDRVAKMIPNLPPAAGRVTIDRAISLSNELQEAIKKDEQIANLIEMAKKIEGTARHSSTHAAGIVITPTPLTDYIPLSVDNNGKIITQFEFSELEKIGLVKMDFLGLANLNIVATVLEAIEKRRNIKLSIEDIPLTDKKTFEMVGHGDTYGVFQLESEGMRQNLKKLKPTSVKDISAMVALYRPGPMNFIDDFIKNKKNPEKIKYIDERFEKILKDSYGEIVYQDDVLFIAVEVAGYTWLEADKFRKAMGKKIKAEMDKQKENLITRLVQHGKISQKQAEDLWHKIETFAGYGFNKGHAAAYGTLAYHTAYLKANFTPEYMSALLQNDIGSSEKLGSTIKECKRLGIKVLAPDINESFRKFTVVDDKTIRFGLEAIKNVGETMVGQIISERKKNGKFISVEDFVKRVDAQILNKKTFESLVLAGAFDSLEKNRKLLIENLANIQEFKKSLDKIAESSQVSLFGSANSITPKLKIVPTEDFLDKEKSVHERNLLGLYVSVHPLEKFENFILQKNLITPDQIVPSLVGKDVDIIGVVGEITKKITKSGDYMAFFKLEGFVNQIESVAFPKNYEAVKTLVSGEVAIVRGKVSVGRTADSMKMGSDEDEIKISLSQIFSPEDFIESKSSKEILSIVENFEKKKEELSEKLEDEKSFKNSLLEDSLSEENDVAEVSETFDLSENFFTIENFSEEISPIFSEEDAQFNLNKKSEILQNSKISKKDLKKNKFMKSEKEIFEEEERQREVLQILQNEFQKFGVKFFISEKIIFADFSSASIKIGDIQKIYNLLNSQKYKIII